MKFLKMQILIAIIKGSFRFTLLTILFWKNKIECNDLIIIFCLNNIVKIIIVV